MPSPTPVRSRARVKWYPPETLYQVRNGGHPYSQTYWLAELSRARIPISVSEPPSPEARFWRDATTRGLTVMPELRGAIMTPARIDYQASTNLTPYNASASPCGWNGPGHTTSPWFLAWQENLGQFVGMSTDKTASSVATPVLEAGDSFWLRYALMAPETDEEGARPRCGLNIHFAPTVSGGAWHSNYGINCPIPHADYPADSVWSVKWNNEVIDTQPGNGRLSSDKSVTDIQWEILEVLSIAGKLVIRAGDGGNAWVVGIDDMDFGVPAGAVVLEFYGQRAAVQWGRTVYAQTATVNGPVTVTPSWANFPAENAGYWTNVGKLGGESTVTMPLFGVVDAGLRQGRIATTITNTSAQVGTLAARRRTTPLLLNFQVVHPALPHTPTAADAIDLSAYVDEVEYTIQESGRGHTASLKIDGRRFDTSQLQGMGLVTIELAHEYGTQPDPEWEPVEGETAPEVEIPADLYKMVFTGYPRRPVAEAKSWSNTLTLALQDRTVLWEGHTAAVHMPYPGGLPFAEAVAFCLEHGQTRASAAFGTVGGAGTNLSISDPVWAALPVPEQAGTASAALDPSADLLAVLDRLCALCYHRWSIGPDGTVNLQHAPSIAAASSYTISASDLVDEVDRPIDAVQSGFDYVDASTVIYVLGRDKLGRGLPVRVYDTDAISDPTSSRYVGWELVHYAIEEDNPNAVDLAQRLLYAAQNRGRTVSPRLYGRFLPRLSVVTNSVPGLAMPTGKEFVVSSLRGHLGGEDIVWVEEYECAVKEGVLIG